MGVSAFLILPKTQAVALLFNFTAAMLVARCQQQQQSHHAKESMCHGSGLGSRISFFPAYTRKAGLKGSKSVRRHVLLPCRYTRLS